MTAHSSSSCRCLSEREALDKLLHFLAAIAFGRLTKPILAAFSDTTFQTLATAIARHKLEQSLLANVEKCLHFVSSPKSAKKPAHDLKDKFTNFVRGAIPTWPSSSWPDTELVALALFIGSCLYQFC
jgi:hypothetical protein